MNALSPIVSNFSGNLMLVKEHPVNAHAPIYVTPFPIVISESP